MRNPISHYVRVHAEADQAGDPKQGSVLANGWAARRGSDDELVPSETVLAKRDDVLNQIVAKIPNGARVLEVGCGDGRLAVLINQTRPDIPFYRGIDLSIEAIEQAKAKFADPDSTGLIPSSSRTPLSRVDYVERAAPYGLGAKFTASSGLEVEFLVANLWEHLSGEVSGDWYIVSCRCLVDETDRRHDKDMFGWVNHRGTIGWFIYGYEGRLARLVPQMQEALANSATVVAHYFEGDRDFLTDERLYGSHRFRPVYLNRSGGFVQAKSPPKSGVKSRDHMASGKFQEDRAKAKLLIDPGISTADQFVISGGMVQEVVPDQDIATVIDKTAVLDKEALLLTHSNFGEGFSGTLSGSLSGSVNQAISSGALSGSINSVLGV